VVDHGDKTGRAGDRKQGGLGERGEGEGAKSEVAVGERDEEATGGEVVKGVWEVELRGIAGVKAGERVE
jgi:hypothetical protein